MSYSNPSSLPDHTLLRIYNDLGAHAFLRDKTLGFGEKAEEFVIYNKEVVRRGLERDPPSFKYLRPEDPDPIFHNSAIMRYDNRQWLEHLRAGKLRFTNAKSYKDDDNLARADDETTTSVSGSLLSPVVKISNEEYKVADFERHHNLIINEKGHRGFFILCFSDVEHPKLQRGFEYDSYVIIKEPWEFTKLACKAFEKKVGRECRYGIGPVKYYSHFEAPQLTTIEDYFLKKRPKHAWQSEIRIYVDHDQAEMNHIYIDVNFPVGLISEIKTLT